MGNHCSSQVNGLGGGALCVDGASLEDGALLSVVDKFALARGCSVLFTLGGWAIALYRLARIFSSALRNHVGERKATLAVIVFCVFVRVHLLFLCHCLNFCRQ